MNDFNAGGSADDIDEPDFTVNLDAQTADDMRALGGRIARMVHGGDVILLSGPLGAGKTTFAQGFGSALGITAPIVSPTFTIARQLNGRFHDGTPAKLIHVDAYRLGSTAYLPGEDVNSRLLDELESLGLDEELEDPSDDSVVLMEWGEQMAVALASSRLVIAIERPNVMTSEREAGSGQVADDLSSDGTRTVSITGVGSGWVTRVRRLTIDGAGKTDA